MAELHVGDIVTILVYFILCFSVGIWSSCRANNASVKGYFLAGRNMHWFPIGASIFATNMGSHFFIGMAGSAAANGIGVIIYEWHAVYVLVLLGWVFVPVYVASKSYTMPAYLRRRYGGQRLRILLSCMAIFIVVVRSISSGMYAGAVFIQQSVGWDMYLCIVSITIVTAVYTIIGGLSAVIWTDAVQTVIMLFGTFFLLVKGLLAVGGFNGLVTKYMHAVPNVTECSNNVTSGYPRADSMHIFRDPLTGDIPWPGAIFGLTPMAIFAWCTDQVLVQRALSAKTHSHAKAGVIMAGYLKLLPMVLVVIPGMISRTLFPNEVGCVDPDICQSVCQNPRGCSNIAYPKLVVEIMPAGLRGLMIAVNLSALMSTLTSIFNSTSSIFTLDLYVRCRRRPSERELMIVGRVFIVALVGISIAWIPLVSSTEGGQLWNYLQAISAYLAPPWCMVFLLGIFWMRTTEQGAFWGLMAGIGTGMVRLVMEFVYSAPACGELDQRPKLIANVHFLYFAIIVSLVTTLVAVVVSLFTSRRPEGKLRHATWALRHSKEPRDETDDEEEIEEENGCQERQTNIVISSDTPNVEVRTVTISRRIYNSLCCHSNFVDKPKLKTMEDEEERKYRGLDEPTWIKRVLNVNAILVMMVATFLLGFFG